MTTFAIDYDGTWTADPAAWERVAAWERYRGHRVLLVTARATGHAEVLAATEAHVDRVIFTPGVPKRVRCAELGENDKPEMVDKIR